MTGNHQTTEVSPEETSSEADRPRGLVTRPQVTPLFYATQAPRYGRQELIRRIEEHTERQLICYVSGPAAMVTRDDVLPLCDLLHHVAAGARLDLLLHTMGGDVDAAEKIVLMLRKATDPDGELRVIVPDSAKSAGTLISLAAKTIVMSNPSELGPIDPQILITGPNGLLSRRPAQSYLDAYDELVAKLKNPDAAAAAYQRLLDTYDPALLDMCRKALGRSQKFAERFLREGMFADGSGNFTAVASRLNDNRQWLSHGAVINCDDARDLDLNITYLHPKSPEWQAYWRLYCQQRLALDNEGQKLFESSIASLPMN
jgi:hypothetical protein